ncbi:MAG: SGNH/GDSL hydrolase family protein [Mobilitalea sp.]
MNKYRKYNIGLCLLLIISLLVHVTGMGASQTVNAATIAKLKSSKESIRVGGTTKIVINNSMKKATYTYKSSDAKVATVTKSGTISGKKVGIAKITVKQTYKEKTTAVGIVEVTVRPVMDLAKVYKNSLVSTGNNYRMKKAIEKAMNGEEVTIAYIGGSITEGYNAVTTSSNYAYLSYQYFKETYGKGDGSNVKFVNAGMAGTPSSLGMVRYDRDVVAQAGKGPDIVFVEFAVNDADDTTAGNAYESLVLNILKAENQPAVVLLFSVFKSKWNLQDRLQPIGEYYGLPMVSIKDSVLPELTSGALTLAEFFSDDYHPTTDGHKLMADCINYYFDTVNKETLAESDIVISETAKIGNSYVGIKMLDSKTVAEGVAITTGGFSDTDTALGTFKYASTTKTFPNNWKHSSATGSKSFTLKLDCKNLVIVYKLSNSKTTGKIDVYVDGVKTQTYDGYTSGGWNNPMTKVVFNNAESAMHTIEIKMAADNTSKDFSILAFGYTK